MNIQKIFLSYKKYCTLSGRARPMEFWVFAFLFYLIDASLGFVSLFSQNVSKILLLVFGLVVLLLILAVMVHRLHDMNRSGWWVCLLIMWLGGMYLMMNFISVTVITVITHYVLLFAFIYVMSRKGTKGENRFGPDPLQGAIGDNEVVNPEKTDNEKQDE